jgi:hypothetical protein
MAAERASARAAEPTATQPMRKGVDQWKPWRMITNIMTSESSSKKPVIMLVIIRPFLIPLSPRLAIGKTLGVAVAELIGEEGERKKRIRTSFNRLCQAERLRSPPHLSLAAQDFLFLC